MVFWSNRPSKKINDHQSGAAHFLRIVTHKRYILNSVMHNLRQENISIQWCLWRLGPAKRTRNGKQHEKNRDISMLRIQVSPLIRLGFNSAVRLLLPVLLLHRLQSSLKKVPLGHPNEGNWLHERFHWWCLAWGPDQQSVTVKQNVHNSLADSKRCSYLLTFSSFQINELNDKTKISRDTSTGPRRLT